MADWLPLITLGAAALGVVALLSFALSLVRGRILRAFGSLVLTSILFAVAGAAWVLNAATAGYRALTREETAAYVELLPTGPQQFTADFLFPDGRRKVFALEGDQIYVDAHILKWRPLVNVLGLHTTYELNRVGGRYLSIDQERDANRTIYSLATPKPIDMFTLRERWAFLEPLLDAEYGSGTFVTVDAPSVIEVRVSTTGLLIRPAER